MVLPAYIQNFFEPWLIFLSENPLLLGAQICMILIGAIVIFFVFYTTRDVLLRTNSFILMFISILLVAVIPVIGFLIYILIRPSRTLKEKEVEALLYNILSELEELRAMQKQKNVQDHRSKNKSFSKNLVNK